LGVRRTLSFYYGLRDFVADRVFLSASPETMNACIALAKERGLGIELMTFSHPALLDGDWRDTVAQYRSLLRGIPGGLTMHGPFFDLAPGSIDPRVNQLTHERYRQALQIAAQLEVPLVVFHANFIAAIRTEDYRRSWLERNITFWGHQAEEAQRLGVTIAIENMWEFDPDIIGDILRRLDHPHLRACLDVGHAHLFSNIPFNTWLARLAPYIIHTHINNTPGNLVDNHLGLHDGVIDYKAMMPKLRALPHRPSFTLEMELVSFMRASLDLLELP
jgi:sugar phosphate isomerase/epimerase